MFINVSATRWRLLCWWLPFLGTTLFCLFFLHFYFSKHTQSLNISLEFDKSVVSELAKLGYNEEYGARELKRVISNKIENMLADKILTNELNAGDCIRVIFNEKSGFATETRKSVKAAEGTG